MLRIERLCEDIKLAISNILINDLEMKLEGLISITEVKITPDLKYATIFISVYNAHKLKTIEILNKYSRYIRGEISKRVKMRNTPLLEFRLDDSIEYGAYMDKVIKNLK
ncbi:MAG: 30S ribosome-binding factor RbfA [Clostridia bacterium]